MNGTLLKGMIPMNLLAVAAIGTVMAIQADGLDTSFKSYMDYNCITDEDSTQYKLQQNAWTDSNGLRRYGGFGDYMIAVGLPYGSVGDRVLVTLDSGESIYCIIGDSKGDRYYHSCNKGACVVEFIVSTQELNEKAKTMGDCSYIENLSGEVQSITTLPSYDEILDFWQRNWSKIGFFMGNLVTKE